MKIFTRSWATNRPSEFFRGPVFLVVLLFAAVLVVGCNPPDQEKTSEDKKEEQVVPQRTINEVMNENVDRIMALDEVVMVAIGELTDGTPCIQVYVKYKSDVLAEEIGVEIEGHPVDFIISDKIQPMD